jgi:hypothetical protein
MNVYIKEKGRGTGGEWKGLIYIKERGEQAQMHMFNNFFVHCSLRKATSNQIGPL